MAHIHKTRGEAKVQRPLTDFCGVLAKGPRQIERAQRSILKQDTKILIILKMIILIT